MLVVISDLHLNDHTSGRHSPPPDAFERVFLPQVVSLARSRRARDVKLLLLGDTFELMRSEHWLRADEADRPWGDHAQADVDAADGSESGRTAQVCLRILGRLPSNRLRASVPEDTILYHNWELLEGIRQFGERVRSELGHALAVEVLFVPGNHDRLTNVYASVRDEVARILGLTINHQTVDGDPDGTWWFRSSFVDPQHGAFGRHGQEFDYWNYGGENDFTRRGHIQVPVGDALGIEFATKLPHRIALRREDNPLITDSLVEFIKDIGLVRPFTDAIRWLYFAIKREDSGAVRASLNEAFDEVVTEILDLKFIQQWRSPGTLTDELVRAASSRWLRWIPKALIDRLDAEEILPFFAGIGHNPRNPEEDVHLRAAYREQIWREDPRIQLILYGHTHFPVQRPLDAAHDHEVIYINTGTWRDSIFRTTLYDRDADFLKLGQIAFTTIYRADEDTDRKSGETVSFDAWSGATKALRRSDLLPRVG